MRVPLNRRTTQPPRPISPVRRGARFANGWAVMLLITGIGGLVPAAASGQQSSSVRPLSLTEALELGMERSEEIQLARSKVASARTQVSEARAGLFPEVQGSVNYSRSLRSPFSVSASPDPTGPVFMPDPTRPLADRVSYLEQNAGLAATAALGQLFADFPIGQKNTWLAQATVTQKLFDPNVFIGLRAAREVEALAGAEEAEAVAELRLQIIEAYLDAVLAEQRAMISDSTAVQLDRQLADVRLIRAAGNASDLDLLRVEVDRQNLEPDRAAALNQQTLAQLNLKRLVNLPLDTPIRLTDGPGAFQQPFVPLTAAEVDAITAEAETRRASINVAEHQVTLQGQQLQAEKSAYLPTVSMTGTFAKQALPTSVFPGSGDFRDDWNLSVGVQIPIFTGGRNRARVNAAREAERQAELRLAQVREAVTMDVVQQRDALDRAAILLSARAQTTAQAVKVYELTDLAYRNGVQTSLQLNDARLQLSQARTNEVQAMHDYLVALVRLERAAGAPVTLDLPAIQRNLRPAGGSTDTNGATR